MATQPQVETVVVAAIPGMAAMEALAGQVGPLRVFRHRPEARVAMAETRSLSPGRVGAVWAVPEATRHPRFPQSRPVVPGVTAELPMALVTAALVALAAAGQVKVRREA